MTGSRVWRCGRFELDLTGPIVMGIVNVTPDSFSDGGRFTTFAEAVEAGAMMERDGAGIVDVGGESTRPGALPVTAEEELGRVLPVVEGLVERLAIPVSIDTRRAGVAGPCLEAGASIVNDVEGFRDDAMVELAAASDAGCVVMHMAGTPETMQERPVYGDVAAEVAEYLAGQARRLEAAGVARERIAVDPGIGFGKTVEHNLQLLRRLPELAEIGYPVLVGASRKRFIGTVLGTETGDRLEGSLAAASWALGHGASVVRVHDVRATVRVALVTAAIANS